MFNEEKMAKLCIKYEIELKDKKRCTEEEINNLFITSKIFEESYIETQDSSI